MANRKVDTGIVYRNGSYFFTAYLGYDVNGKQVRKTMTWKPSEKMAEKKADKLAKEQYIEFKKRCSGCANLDENMRFNELVEKYMEIFAPNELKPITKYNYEKMIAFHFHDYFGNKRLKDISKGMLSDYFCKQTVTKKDGSVVPMAPSTVKRLYTIMQSLFHFAISQEFIKVNPCTNIILPKKNPSEDEKRKFLTEEELPRFVALFDGYSDFNTMVKILLYTGMRSGEMLGLQWADIDFNNRMITVNHTLSDVGGDHFLTTPKTKTSKRNIAMTSTVYDLLKEHRKHQFELQMAIKNFSHPEMVFTSATGNYKDRSCLNTSFRRFLKGTDFEFMTLHCLRHSNATLLLNSGVDIKIVSEHLGHSDIGTTGNIYADVLNTSRRKTAEILEMKLKQA